MCYKSGLLSYLHYFNLDFTIGVSTRLGVGQISVHVLIDGQDNTGWSTDMDCRYLSAALQRLKINETGSILRADVVHNVWWNSLLKLSKLPLRFKKHVVVTASNFIDLSNPDFHLTREFCKVKAIAQAWIAPSERQKSLLESYGLKVFYHPFAIDLELFKPIVRSEAKLSLYEKFKIPPEILSEKIVIGSFQRDSLGADLTQPKLQKGPDLLVEILKDLPKDRFILLLAGPRRHFLRQKCKEVGIPYYFLGKEIATDDIGSNIIRLEEMPDLYALCDLYLVTSRSEGGPKAVMEAAATETCVFSTEVGLVSDFLLKRNIFKSIDEFKARLSEVVRNFTAFSTQLHADTKLQAKKTAEILSVSASDRRIASIYEEILK